MSSSSWSDKPNPLKDLQNMIKGTGHGISIPEKDNFSEFTESIIKQVAIAYEVPLSMLKISEALHDTTKFKYCEFPYMLECVENIDNDSAKEVKMLKGRTLGLSTFIKTYKELKPKEIYSWFCPVCNFTIDDYDMENTKLSDKCERCGNKWISEYKPNYR